MRIKLVGLAVLCLICGALAYLLICRFGVNGVHFQAVKQDGAIDGNLTNRMKALNSDVLDALRAGDADGVKQFFLPELADVPGWGAEVDNKRGWLLSSLLALAAGRSTVRPIPIFEWEGLDARYLEAENRIQFAFSQALGMPLVVEEVTSSPQVFGFMHRLIGDEDTLVLEVRYISAHSLSETDMIDQESRQLDRALGAKIPGLHEIAPYTIYKAFNELASDPTKKYPAYGVVISRTGETRSSIEVQ